METDRWIVVSIGIHQNFLTVLISDSIAGPVNLRSKKQDKKNHGFGLKNLTECVERNNGVVRRRMDKDKFVLDIVVSAFKVLL